MWQPIETAPKDRYILVWHNPNVDIFYDDSGTLTAYGCYVENTQSLPESVYVAQWLEGYTEDESGEGWGPYTHYPSWWFVAFDEDGQLPLNPTHWMELPNKP